MLWPIFYRLLISTFNDILNPLKCLFLYNFHIYFQHFLLHYSFLLNIFFPEAVNWYKCSIRSWGKLWLFRLFWPVRVSRLRAGRIFRLLRNVKKLGAIPNYYFLILQHFLFECALDVLDKEGIGGLSFLGVNGEVMMVKLRVALGLRGFLNQVCSFSVLNRIFFYINFWGTWPLRRLIWSCIIISRGVATVSTSSNIGFINAWVRIFIL